MGDYWASHGQLFRISKVLLSPTQSRFRISKQLCDGRRTQLAIQKGLICANFKDPSLEIVGSAHLPLGRCLFICGARIP